MEPLEMDALASREDTDLWFGDPRMEGSEHPDARPEGSVDTNEPDHEEES